MELVFLGGADELLLSFNFFFLKEIVLSFKSQFTSVSMYQCMHIKLIEPAMISISDSSSIGQIIAICYYLESSNYIRRS